MSCEQIHHSRLIKIKKPSGRRDSDMKKLHIPVIIAACVLIVAGVCLCADETAKTKGGAVMEIKIESPAFGDNEMIPSKYTCDGANVSPPLKWSGVPSNTKSLALICDDPDAPMGTWVHWVVYNIPPSAKEFTENFFLAGKPDKSILQGVNDFRKASYGGPCPPSGVHRYHFKVYALDTILELKPGATKQQLLFEIEGHLLGQGQLTGKYRRR
jgi:hypothetical protein